MRHWHFLKSTGDIRTPHQGPQRGWGMWTFTPRKRGWGGGGQHKKSFGVVFTWYLKVLAILKRWEDTKSFHSLKEGGGGEKCFTLSRGGRRGGDFPILYCPLLINDQSIRADPYTWETPEPVPSLTCAHPTLQHSLMISVAPPTATCPWMPSRPGLLPTSLPNPRGQPPTPPPPPPRTDKSNPAFFQLLHVLFSCAAFLVSGGVTRPVVVAEGVGWPAGGRHRALQPLSMMPETRPDQ